MSDDAPRDDTAGPERRSPWSRDAEESLVGAMLLNAVNILPYSSRAVSLRRVAAKEYCRSIRIGVRRETVSCTDRRTPELFKHLRHADLTDSLTTSNHSE